MILAAGLGTRLKPLTDGRPKALVTVGGQTLLEITAARMAEAGVRRCVVNIHAHSDMMRDFIAGHIWPCEMVVSDESERLLDTGGALAHAAPLFSGKEPIMVHNVDVVSTIDLREVVQHHLLQRNLVTLCVSQRETKRQLLFDAEGLLRGRQTDSLATGLHPLAFSGISVISPDLLSLLPADGEPFPAIDYYISLSKRYRIGSYLHDARRWLDVGTPERLEEAERRFGMYR